MTDSVMLNFIRRLYAVYLRWYENGAISRFLGRVAGYARSSAVCGFFYRFARIEERKSSESFSSKVAEDVSSAFVRAVKRASAFFARVSASGIAGSVRRSAPSFGMGKSSLAPRVRNSAVYKFGAWLFDGER